MKLGLGSKIRKAFAPGAFRRKVVPYLWYYSGLAFLVALLCRLRPVRRGKIVFNNFHGKGFGDHQKYIALELLRRKSPVELVWLAEDPQAAAAGMPAGIRVAKYSPLRAIREMSTAQFWCSNQSFDAFVLWGLGKRRGQCYIQTFHGSLGIKRIGQDRPTDGSVQLWLKVLMRDAEMTDFLISNATWESELVYRSRFFGFGDIKLFGHPRNDVFFSDGAAARHAVRARFGLSDADRIVLYAPTHRPSRRWGMIDGSLVELAGLFSGRFGGTWRFMVRAHPNLANSHGGGQIEAGVADATFYPDIQDLLVAADALISDYSSCMFDFMLTRRPVFVFAPDIADYERDRGFYYPMSETPFPVAKTEAELAENIREFDEAKYREGVEAFLKGKGCVEDGHATERVCDLIESRL